ncbi:hypothetical protein [Sulfurovum sp.]|uniref:hypothetical protein n=1 Tax=Sulfurovum sp. TaxID=1969726 RepID=UPI0035662053
MTWGWLKHVLSALGKMLGALFLINHGKQKAKTEQLEDAAKLNKKLTKLNNTPVAPGVDIRRMLKKRRN